jgi:hypothetical protein
MTFRVLKSRELHEFPAAGAFRAASPSVSSSDRSRHPVEKSVLSANSSTLQARVKGDGDCLRGLGLALGIEASAAAFVVGVWSLVQWMR